jgi:serine/threonine protein kinase
LPAAFPDDAERLARFTREAQTLASLNHPNIATIHGIEELPATGGSGAGSRALVMELVEGEDLSAHIARGPIPIAEALPLGRQIADALEAAHEQGIVHREGSRHGRAGGDDADVFRGRAAHIVRGPFQERRRLLPQLRRHP